jgi:photosynthetic reaction center M subunit
MATYQNIFTQVQVQGPPEMGVPHLDGSEGRIALIGHSYWMGKLGQAQTIWACWARSHWLLAQLRS